jgi:hypothetical protein
MALTDIERRILETARDAIRSGRNTYVCVAIDKAVIPRKYDQVRSAKGRLRRYVERSLAGHLTLDGWLSANKRTSWRTKARKRKARIAWISWMLGEDFNLDREL